MVLRNGTSVRQEGPIPEIDNSPQGVSHKPGILSQVLTSSPNIKQILPAKVRSAIHNDIIFVGVSSVQLREFTPGGYLTNALAELDLGVQILTATVISASSRVVDVQDAILENGRDEIRYTIDGKPLDDSQPPQILVLSIATGELVYAYAKQCSTSRIEFVFARRPILGSTAWPSKYGKHLAIDPDSRALAVSSLENSFGILSLRNVVQIKQDIDAWDPRDPSKLRPLVEQRFIQVDGVILRIDFLRSKASDPKRLLLVLLVANVGITRMLAYCWDSSRPLSGVRPLRSSGQQLLSRRDFPYLLIPSCVEASFSIVTSNEITFYEDVTLPQVRQHKGVRTQPHDQADKNWVQWARPYRSERYRQGHEDVMIFREDGKVKAVIIDQNTNTQSILQYDVHGLQIPLDTAICSIPAPAYMGGDIWVLCGDMNFGAVYHCLAVSPPRLLQQIHSFVPMYDTMALDRKSAGRLPGDKSTVFATAGRRDSQATLIELQHGHEAQVDLTIPLEDTASVDDLWILHGSDMSDFLIASSYPEHTAVMHYSASQDELAFLDSASHPNIIFDESSLLFEQYDSDIIIQVTRTQLSLTSLSNIPLQVITAESGFHYACAAYESMNGNLAIVQQCASSSELLLYTLSSSNLPDGLGAISARILFNDCTPANIAICSTQKNSSLCVLVSQDGTLHLYHFGGSGDMHLLGRIPLCPHRDQPVSTTPSSIGVLTIVGDRGLILCGTREGQVFVNDFYLSIFDTGAKLTTRSCREETIGKTAVRLTCNRRTGSSMSNEAILSCEDRVRSLTVHGSSSTITYVMNDVCVTLRNDASFRPQSISAMKWVSAALSERHTSAASTLVWTSSEGILFTGFSAPRVVPRIVSYIQSSGCTIWSPFLRKFVAASNSGTQVGHEPDAPRPDLSKLFLRLVDPEATDLPAASTDVVLLTSAAENQAIKGLLNFRPTDGSQHYEMIIIATQAGRDGRLSLISASRIASGEREMKLRRIAIYHGKTIRAMCAFGLSSLAVCVGKEVKLLKLSLQTRRWEETGSFELASPGCSLIDRGSVLCVATSLHSFILLRETNGRLEDIGSDRWAGSARQIISFDKSSYLTNIVSDSGSRILGFQERPMKGTSPAFEARIPIALDDIVQLHARGPAEERCRFIGTAIDGSICLFTIVDKDERRLLKFLEELCEPQPSMMSARTRSLAHKVANLYGHRLETKGLMPPSTENTHIRGGVMKRMLETDQFDLRRLLAQQVKMETEGIKVEEGCRDRLRLLAAPLIEVSDDLTGDVTSWLRRIMNVPSL